jgi:hypothetical protein
MISICHVTNTTTPIERKATLKTVFNLKKKKTKNKTKQKNEEIINIQGEWQLQ